MRERSSSSLNNRGDTANDEWFVSWDCPRLSSRLSFRLFKPLQRTNRRQARGRESRGHTSFNCGHHFGFFSLAARELCVSQFKSSRDKVESACLCDRLEVEGEEEGEAKYSLYSILPEASRAGLSASAWVRRGEEAAPALVKEKLSKENFLKKKKRKKN